MKKNWSLMFVAGALTLAGCGVGVDAQDAQPGDMGAVMGDGFREQGMERYVPPEGTVSEMATVCPGSTIQRGIDVSVYQGTVTWSSVKSAGKNFAFIRVSDGTGTLDANFATNWSKAKAAGLTVGAYQFFRPSQDPIAQADLIVNKVQAAGYVSTDLPIVIDVEVTGSMSNATIISRVNQWLQRVQSRTGRLPALYTSPGFWSSIGNPTPSPLPYLWVAHWGATCPTLPPAWGRLRWWQYSDSGSVSGISGAVDLDEYNGSLAEMRSL